MSEYGNGFTLDFAYCKNCRFHLKKDATLDFELAYLLKKEIERRHDRHYVLDMPTCPKRELVISYNRVMIEKV